MWLGSKAKLFFFLKKPINFIDFYNQTVAQREEPVEDNYGNKPLK